MTPEELRNWRERHGFTQAQAAKALELCESAYEHKEYGKRPITKRDIKLIRYIDRDAAKKKATK